MTDLLYLTYPWTKAFHIIAVISWMAGIFYLPRLFVHHTEQTKVGSETDSIFAMMELKLYKVIMTPAMVVTWICGVLLALTPGMIDWMSVWPWVKLICVLGMSGFHGWLGKQRKVLAAGHRKITGKTFRLMNEVPTVLMIIIVVCVIVRPL